MFQDDAGVDYAGMRKSAGFAEYSALAKELGNKDLDLGSMSELGALCHLISIDGNKINRFGKVHKMLLIFRAEGIFHQPLQRYDPSRPRNPGLLRGIW